MRVTPRSSASWLLSRMSWPVRPGDGGAELDPGPMSDAAIAWIAAGSALGGAVVGAGASFLVQWTTWRREDRHRWDKGKFDALVGVWKSTIDLYTLKFDEVLSWL